MSLSPEQLAMRRTGLTASDIVVLSGTVPYKKARTVYDLYLDKVRPELVRPTEVTEAMELGHEVEPAIVARAARKLGVAVVYPQTTVRHESIEWAMATPDALIVGNTDRVGLVPMRLVEKESMFEVGLIEAKLVGLHAAPWWDVSYEEADGAGPPDYVFTQAVWQAFVKRLPYVVVAAMIGTEFRLHRIEFDSAAQEYAGALVEVGEKFLVDHVRPKRPPPVDGSASSREMLSALFRRPNQITLKADDEAEQMARAYFAGKRQREEGEQLMDQAKTAMMARMQENYGLKGDGWSAVWGEQKGYHVEAYDVAPMRKFGIRPVKGR